MIPKSKKYAAKIGEFYVLRDSPAGRIIQEYWENAVFIAYLREDLKYPFPEDLLGMEAAQKERILEMKAHIGDPLWGFLPEAEVTDAPVSE